MPLPTHRPTEITLGLQAWFGMGGIVVSAGLLLPGCEGVRTAPAPPPARVAVALGEPSDAVQFRIQALPQDGKSQTWLATHTKNGKTAHWKIRVDRATGPADSPFQFGKGAFLRAGHSDPSALLPELARVLGAHKKLTAVQHVSQLPFGAAFLGESMSRVVEKDGRSSAFAPNPPGGWQAMKVFLGANDAEVFLNLNPSAGIGEFSPKDEDYGDEVLHELARVL